MEVQAVVPADPPSDPEPSRIGEVLSGKYLVVAELGTGGMGTVYECENFAISRRVAIKILSPDHVSQGEAVRRFQREARAAAQIGHPHIVDVLDMGETDEGLPYMVMERLEGEDLATVLERQGALPPVRAVELMLQILDALDAAHERGIIHRDLKPENVFLARLGQRTDFVKILDFGVAQVHDVLHGQSVRLTRDGTTVGTPMYMSPEQARGKVVDARSDVYAAGALLYEMIGGTAAHRGDNYNAVMASILTKDPPALETLAPGIPGGLADAVHQAMARDLEERFQTVADFARAIEPLLGEVEVEVAVAPRPDVAPRREALTLAAPAASRRSLRWIALPPLVAIAVTVVFLWPADRPAPSRARRPEAPARADRASARPEAPTSHAAVLSLDVSANVDGASVLLDGAVLGRTPLSAIVPRSELRHVLRIEAEGYEPIERDTTLLEPVRVSFELRRLPQPAPPRARKGRGLLFDESVYRR